MFKKATKMQAKLRLALTGTSGSGKTTGALMIAKGLGGKIAVLDTERGSASLYADQYDFDVVELAPPYTPERYIEVIKAAEKEGYDTLILDSITHEWSGQGGILEIVDAAARAKYKGNSYAAWNEGTPRHQKFLDAMLASSCHIIATMRSKAVYVESEKSNGKKSIEKQGSAPQQRDGLEYEFTAVLDINVDRHLAVASKDRTRLFNDPFTITEQTGIDLKAWLEDGEKCAPAPISEPESAKPIEDSVKQKKAPQNAEKADIKQAPAQAPNAMKIEDIPMATVEQLRAIAGLLQQRGVSGAKGICDAAGDFLGRHISAGKEITSAEAGRFIDALQGDF